VLYYKNNVGALLNLLIVRFVGLLNNQWAFSSA
jgi:hypothetical protein